MLQYLHLIQFIIYNIYKYNIIDDDDDDDGF